MTTEQRRATRVGTDLKADVRRGGATRIPGIVTDMSISGFRVRADEKLPLGSTVWVRINPLAPLMAQVIWSQHYVAGCTFSSPLHPAVLDHIVATGE